jgi:hypothetical protein
MKMKRKINQMRTITKIKIKSEDTHSFFSWPTCILMPQERKERGKKKHECR